MGLFTRDRNFIITNLDSQTIDLRPYQFTQANITLFRIINRDEAQRQEFENIDNMLAGERQNCEDKPDLPDCSEQDLFGKRPKMA